MKSLLVDKSPERLMAVFAGGPGAVFTDSSHLRYMDIPDSQAPPGWIGNMRQRPAYYFPGSGPRRSSFYSSG